ncbi:MAG TPA: hypothetical protein ENI80_03505 [Acidiferrobacteraceae bacterium]|nr:hypothetical protein [Acidiferrobacteraceae bacterium]
MHPADIKCALEKHGYTQMGLSHEQGVSPVMIYNVINGISTSRRIASRIAKIIDLPLEDIWPGLYKNEPRGKAA